MRQGMSRFAEFTRAKPWLRVTLAACPPALTFRAPPGRLPPTASSTSSLPDRGEAVTSLETRTAAAAEDRGAARAHPDARHWIGGEAGAGGPGLLHVLGPSTGAGRRRV